MLAVISAVGARTDAASLGLVLARQWGEAGDAVLLVDADPVGARFAQRLGTATRVEYRPAQRGMPTLIVARQPLNLATLVAHCYSLDVGAGSLWALFAPFHVDACRYAAAWLADRASALVEVDRQRTVLVTTSLPGAAETLAPLLQACSVTILIAPVESTEAAAALRSASRDAGLMTFERDHRLIVVEGTSPLDDETIRIETGMHVAGRLPELEAGRLLHLQRNRKDRSLKRQIDEMAERVRNLLSLHGAAGADLLGGDSTEPQRLLQPAQESV